MSNQKNVIWFVADQLRGQALSCHGDANVHTPNIDLLAAQGVDFPYAVSGNPLCSPFRACMVTSKYSHNNTVPGHDFSLDPKMPTIADVFNENGYDTLYFGKWHMDGDYWRQGTGIDARDQVIPKERTGGFKTWIGYENVNSQFDVTFHGHDGDKVIEPYRLKKFETDAVTDMMIERLNQYAKAKQSGKKIPFFAVMSVQPPHDPYTAPADFAYKYHPKQLILRPNVPPYEKCCAKTRKELAGYYALIENIDWNLGRLRQALRDTGLDLDTHILFFSDHGDMHGSHGMFRKTNPYEESVRIPFIIGGGRPMGYYNYGCGESKHVINHVDIAPTTLGLCGIDAPEWMCGYDYSFERLPGERQPKGKIPESAYIQSIVPTLHDNSTDKPYRGIVTEDGYKYVCFEDMPWLMFDLNEDPYELTNLAHIPQYAAKRHALNELLKNWVKDTGDNFRVPELSYTSWPVPYETYRIYANETKNSK